MTTANDEPVAALLGKRSRQQVVDKFQRLTSWRGNNRDLDLQQQLEEHINALAQ